jgi:hypothetical protein
MGRAARLKKERREAKGLEAANGQTISLQNPVSEHFASFILGNAQYCDHVVMEGSAKGQHLILCGAGPSLAEHADEWCPKGGQIWGCNSALTWLQKHGHKPTHGFTVDQTAEMVSEWASAPDVEYMVASTVHPHLVEYLLSKERRLMFFHNYVGINRAPVRMPDEEGNMVTMGYEDWMYCALYEGTVRAGSGLNAVTRAIDVARYMGFDQITVLGADCALRVKGEPREDLQVGSPDHLAWLRSSTVMHADGGSALASNATPVTLGGWIDAGTTDRELRDDHKRYWLTKPDMMISAVWLTQMQRTHSDVITLVGDTLPNALTLKTAAYLDQLPKLQDSSGQSIQYRDSMTEGGIQ